MMTLAAGWLVLVSFTAMMAGCTPGSIEETGVTVNSGANAAWLGVEWVHTLHSDEEIADLAAALRDRQINTVYVFVSYLKADGDFNPTYAYAGHFVEAMRSVGPELDIQAWVGLPLQYADLGDPTVREGVVEFCAEILETAPFDGVHLDPEPVASDDADLLLLLDEIRNEIAPDSVLSIATRRIMPVCPDAEVGVLTKYAWRASYYQEIADRVDQIAVMIYDSALPLPGLYRCWTRVQVRGVIRALDGRETQVFFGVPTSEERTRTHSPRAENMMSGLRGVVDGLAESDVSDGLAVGVAIYPYWDTSEAEWDTYERLWLGLADANP